jgi:tRNA(Ile)-lysidine synthase
LKSAPDSLRSADAAFAPPRLEHVLTHTLGIAPATPIRVAYSGGLDSTVLLTALVSLRWPVTAIHINHGLNPAAANWAQHCRDTCTRLNVPLEVVNIEVTDVETLGLEAAARRARYAALRERVRPGEVLVTAHHLDDQAETVLLQLLRGGGVAGLAAMPARTVFGGGWHARPLLAFTRSSLRAYAELPGLTWIEDSSNDDESLARNFLRRRILPALRERWPQAAQVLGRSARHAADAAALLAELAEGDLRTCAGPGAAVLSIPALLQLSAPRQRNVLRHWLKCEQLPLPSDRQLMLLLAGLVTTPASQHSCVRWPGAELRRYRDQLYAFAESARPAPWPARPWVLDQPLDLPEAGIRLRAHATSGDGIARARIGATPLTVRPRQGGETCQLHAGGHRQALKKLLQAAGVPPWLRQTLPLIYAGEVLVAVADRWVCEPYTARAGEPSVRIVIETLTRAPQR